MQFMARYTRYTSIAVLVLSVKESPEIEKRRTVLFDTNGKTAIKACNVAIEEERSIHLINILV